ncbi:uncharacterized protein LOC125501868 [Athalia rosae]|uniref:uncharacterized protein LOC125501868 n=1 Tax=Athalia rosae TaxID=37344 RepID=UPI002033A20A|nr:uncharacterized protein LOC125501868 [Athalia rosae]
MKRKPVERSPPVTRSCKQSDTSEYRIISSDENKIKIKKISKTNTNKKTTMTDSNVPIIRSDQHVEVNGIQDNIMRMEIQKEWRRLKEEQAKIDQQRADLERTRLEMIQQSQADQLQIQIPDNDQVVSGLVKHLQYLHIDVKVPKFSENGHPVDFLEDLERYFKYKNVRGDHRLLVIESILEGRVKIWYEVTKGIINDYEAFRLAFEAEFYSIPVQVRFKNQWLSRRYRQQDGSLLTYFYKQLRDTRHFQPKLPTYEINYLIAQQLPSRVRTALATVDLANTNLVVQVLSQLDEVHEEYEKRESGRVNGHHYNNQGQNSGNKNIRSANLSNITVAEARDKQNWQASRGYQRYQAQRPRQNRGDGNWRVRQSQAEQVAVVQQNRPSYSNQDRMVVADTRFPPPRINDGARMHYYQFNNTESRPAYQNQRSDSNSCEHLN